ncbi:MAG: polyprenol monophosphomannose synthase [Anaerolineales bacterium]|nr:polyprenol monophosphomannose synthase [Anaerolineales bacterium]
MRITVCIPTYNEAGNIPRLAETLFALPLKDLSILFIDDNSPDGTAQVVEQVAGLYPGRISLHRRPTKLGLGTAYIAGFGLALESGAEAIAQMDADFSHPPEKLVELAAALETHDVAIGSRYVAGGSLDERWPLWRKGLSAFGNFYARTILNLSIRDVTGGFRLWSRRSIESLPLDSIRSSGYVFQVELAYLTERLGLRSIEIPIHFADRRWGQSKMSLRIQLEAAMRVWMVRFSYRDIKPVPVIAPAYNERSV